MYISLLITIACCLLGEVFSNSLFAPCKKTDLTCIENTVNDALPKLFDGIPELGIERSDPQFVETIEGNLSILKYKFTNSSLHGYKNCKMSNLKFNDDLTKLSCDMTCAPVRMNGKYEMKGRLITLPIEGKGDYAFDGAGFFLNVDIELDKIKESEGKTHFFVKDFKIKSKAITQISFNFQNLFNGQKDLAAAIKKFARENWVEVTELVQDPIWKTSLDQMLSAVNKYLKTFAIEDTILN